MPDGPASPAPRAVAESGPAPAPTTLQILRSLDTGPRGLTDEEADLRLARHGENTLPARRTPPWPGRFVRGLRDPFTAVLLCLGLVSATVSAWGTAGVITLLVAVSCALRATGEHRADRAMDALRDLVPTTATVVRRPAADAPPAPRELPVDQLVPGDIVRLGPGDLVPADVHLVAARGLYVNQAPLTGESEPVPKHPVPPLPPASTTAPSVPVASGESHRCFQGSSVTAGGGTAVVTATGGRTRFAAATGGVGTAGAAGTGSPLPGAGNPLPGTGTPSLGTGSPLPGAGNPLPGTGPPSLGTGSASSRTGNPSPRTGSASSRTGNPSPRTGNPSPRTTGTPTPRTAKGASPGARAAGSRPAATAFDPAATAFDPAATAFDRSVHGISWILIRFMLLTPPLVLMADAALRGRGLETLPFAVAVAVGLTPEMLPVVVTTCLARGAARLARTHGVIVRRLPALHDLGAMDVLCVDKTGTLTRDRPVVERGVTADGHDAPEALHWAAVNAWWTLQLADPPAPDALDEAILDAAGEDALTSCEGVTALPFDPVRRLATAVVLRPGAGLGVHTLVVKGAVENVLEHCALSDEERAPLHDRAARLAADGLRVLAVATADRRARHRDWTPADVRGLTFRGFVTLRDELAPAAGPALRALADRGVTVKLLTGDHPGTAARVCRDLGVALAPDDVRTAADIDALTPAELADVAHRTTVFARCTPAHKARVVEALRTRGHTTGFLGDGVNDLPALRTADVGVAPHDAVPVARETADVVLPDSGTAGTPGLTAIDHAVTAGRGSSANIATYLRITLSSNLGNVIAMLTAGLLLPFLPMLPAQVLAQNLCFDAAQLAFAYERPARAALRRPTALRPRALLRFITGFGVLNAVADLATFAVLALAVPGPTGTEDESVFHSGWFTENLLTQALVMLLLRTVRGRSTPVTWAAAALAVTGLLLPLSPLGPLLAMTALPPLYYGLLAAVLALYATALWLLGHRTRRRLER
ncbi:HAD-IC family P-type ATPase [Streptomyces sp. NPDC002564]|uniref:HAD-IC family P-type ATPase n=1 Tax=Streptomyces sp. NPDC002564 TaxID=3364649 RepID=UPI00369AB3F4